jgi:hypothetical protein
LPLVHHSDVAVLRTNADLVCQPGIGAAPFHRSSLPDWIERWIERRVGDRPGPATSPTKNAADSIRASGNLSTTPAFPPRTAVGRGIRAALPNSSISCCVTS